MNIEKAIVTGGAGFIGSHICEALLERGIKVVVYDNLSVGTLANVPKEAAFIKGDILDKKRFTEALTGVHVVFHLAAKVSIRASMDDFVEDSQNNLMGTVNILSCLPGSDVKKFIMASSMAVYADSPTSDPLPESYTLEPLSPYGISKLAAEKYALLVCKELGIDCIVLRYFNTYGIRQTLTPYVGVITIFINSLFEKRPLTIFGDGKQVRDFVHVKDIAEASLLAMEHGKGDMILNVGTGRGTSVEEIALMLREKINPGVDIQYSPPRKEELKNSVADISKAKESILYHPMHILSENIEDVIEWNRNKVSKA
jgi:UDP-glucose 4-epimerase